jgi:type III secretory pathway component EscR
VKIWSPALQTYCKTSPTALTCWIITTIKHGVLRNSLGQQLIGNNALAAITLMIALSAPEEKDIMCLLVMNMLNTE